MAKVAKPSKLPKTSSFDCNVPVMVVCVPFTSWFWGRPELVGCKLKLSIVCQSPTPNKAAITMPFNGSPAYTCPEPGTTTENRDAAVGSIAFKPGRGVGVGGTARMAGTITGVGDAVKNSDDRFGTTVGVGLSSSLVQKL